MGVGSDGTSVVAALLRCGVFHMQATMMSGGSGRRWAIRWCTSSCGGGQTLLSSLHCQVCAHMGFSYAVLHTLPAS